MNGYLQNQVIFYSEIGGHLNQALKGGNKFSCLLPYGKSLLQNVRGSVPLGWVVAKQYCKLGKPTSATAILMGKLSICL